MAPCATAALALCAALLLAWPTHGEFPTKPQAPCSRGLLRAPHPEPVAMGTETWEGTGVGGRGRRCDRDLQIRCDFGTSAPTASFHPGTPLGPHLSCLFLTVPFPYL